MSNNLAKEMKVGALIAIGLLVIFAAFFAVGSQEGLFASKYELRARFVNVEGLTVGAAVRLGGVKVGSVSRIGFSPDGLDKHIIITMSVNSRSFDRFRKDSNARLGSQGLLGDRTIDITVGSADSGRLMEGDFVNTIEAAQLSDLISESGDAMTDLKITAQNAKEISWKINHGSGTIAQFINDPRLYTSLDSLLNLWSDITTKLNSGRGTLAKIVNDSALYVNLTGSLYEIKTFMANVNDGTGTLGKVATDDRMYNRFDSLLTAIQNTLVKINEGGGTASQLVNSADMYEKFNSTIDALNALIIDIKQNPKKYVKLSLF